MVAPSAGVGRVEGVGTEISAAGVLREGGRERGNEGLGARRGGSEWKRVGTGEIKMSF